MMRAGMTDEEYAALSQTTDDGYHVTPTQRYEFGDPATGTEPGWVRDGFAARYVDGRYRYDASHGATADEALGKARKAMAKRLAQRTEDLTIQHAYEHRATVLGTLARRAMPGTPMPTTVDPGDVVWVWGHGKARAAIVGSVSKTGKRARLIWVAPSNGSVHIVTASLTDLQVMA